MLVYIKSKKQGNSEHCLDSCVKLIMRWFMYKVHWMVNINDWFTKLCLLYKRDDRASDLNCLDKIPQIVSPYGHINR